MNETVTQNNDVFAATMNALIIYDEFDFAATAKAMLERAAHRTDTLIRWSVRPWRVDILKHPPAADAALAEAAEAHLILVAMRQVLSVLPWLLDWLERWAKCRQIPDAALAVWDGGSADPPSVRTAPEFSQFTGRHDLCLIFGDNPLVADKSSMFMSDLHEREVAWTSTLHHIMEQPLQESYRHWGINE